MATPKTGNPRGRPKGSKNFPKAEDFIALSLGTGAPAAPLKPKRAPSGIWAKLKTPEERSAYSRKISAMRTSKPTGGRKRGVPGAFSAQQYAEIVASQKPIVAGIIKKMKRDGLLENPLAAEAVKTAMMVMRTAGSEAQKIAAARILLDFIQPRGPIDDASLSLTDASQSCLST